MPAPIPESKPTLRKWAREIRVALDFPALSKDLCGRLITLPEFQRAENVLLYAAMPDELDVLSLAQIPEKRFYLSRCAEKRRLTIHEYPCPLVRSTWGVREPGPNAPEISPDTLDLVVVPGLAFTCSGNRLGYGGGFYDRLLPRLRLGCVTVGVCPDELVVEKLPVDSWDLPVEILVTPAEIFRGGV